MCVKKKFFASLPEFANSQSYRKELNYSMLPFLFIHLRRKFVRIDHKDIRYVLAVGHHVKIATDQAVYLPHLSLKEIETALPTDLFCRINRSTLVAMDRITFFDRETVSLKDVSFSFSDKYRKELESKCTILLHKDTIPERHFSEKNN